MAPDNRWDTVDSSIENRFQIGWNKAIKIELIISFSLLL